MENLGILRSLAVNAVDHKIYSNKLTLDSEGFNLDSIDMRLLPGPFQDEDYITEFKAKYPVSASIILSDWFPIYLKWYKGNKYLQNKLV